MVGSDPWQPSSAYGRQVGQTIACNHCDYLPLKRDTECDACEIEGYARLVAGGC